MKHHHSRVLALALLLLSWGCFSQGAPVSPQRFGEGQELRQWSEINDLCSSFLSDNPQPQPLTPLEELCYMARTILQQDSEDKGQRKRSSVLHPLLQLVPELHLRRMKKGRGSISRTGFNIKQRLFSVSATKWKELTYFSLTGT
ncbi:neuromedin-U isoform X5 [Pristis pectinata]|uniref:neuromedin-U isoform X5 n=1 Tax=Pristis pectinata TaxID=685728 RepID=UPI00223E8C4A|nr:neuromedin-U isoform X5 [Pristis pectinata]